MERASLTAIPSDKGKKKMRQLFGVIVIPPNDKVVIQSIGVYKTSWAALFKLHYPTKNSKTCIALILVSTNNFDIGTIDQL